MISKAWIPSDPEEIVHIVLQSREDAVNTACLIDGWLLNKWLPDGELGVVSQPMPGQPENRCKKCMEALRNGNNDQKAI